MWMLPLYLHINKKSSDDDDDDLSQHLRWGGHIVFGANPVVVSVGITLSCLHNTKNWLDFGNLDLIFKITE